MNRMIRKAVPVGILAAGFVLVSGGAAHAAGNAGIGTGNSITTTVNAPVSITNNAVAFGGFGWAGKSSGDSSASSNGQTWSKVKANGQTWSKIKINGQTWSKIKANGQTWSKWHMMTGGSANANDAGDDTGGWNTGALNGNTVNTSVNAPVTVCGNAVAYLGFTSASC
jgi:hypothetical protein